jgi:hypothetical protein
MRHERKFAFVECPIGTARQSANERTTAAERYTVFIDDEPGVGLAARMKAMHVIMGICHSSRYLRWWRSRYRKNCKRTNKEREIFLRHELGRRIPPLFRPSLGRPEPSGLPRVPGTC